MVAIQFIILPLPNHRSVLGIQARVAVCTKAHIHAPRLHHRRGRCVAIHRYGALLRLGNFEHKFYATKRQMNGLKKSLDFFNHDDRKVTLRKMFEVNPYDFFYNVNSKESGEVASAIR